MLLKMAPEEDRHSETVAAARHVDGQTVLVERG
jgi:hypothetical protein